MARIIYSSIVNEIRGKLGSSVFQKCGTALSIRSLSTKALRFSSVQLISQNQFRALANAWRLFSDAQRLTYKTNAPSWPTLNDASVRVVLGAWQLYLFVNRTLHTAGLTVRNNCPVFDYFAWGVEEVDNYDLSAQTCTILFFGTVPASCYILISVSDLFLQSNSPSSPKLYYAGKVMCAGLASTGIYTMLHQFWGGVPSSNQAFAFSISVVNDATGVHYVDISGKLNVIP
jgi:hypothetical protein